MVYVALEVVKALKNYSIFAGVIDLFIINPVNEAKLFKVIKDAKYVVTLEEHSLVGGLGSSLCRIKQAQANKFKFKAIGLQSNYYGAFNDRQLARCINKIDVDSIVEEIRHWIRNDA